MRKSIPVLLVLLWVHALAAGQDTDAAISETPMVLQTTTGEISGTLTLPPEGSGFPIALIVAGSGPTDRNGNSIFSNNDALKMLAHQLALAGIASLRYDKRGVGKSAKALKKELDVRFEDYIQDAVGWIELIKKDQQFSTITVIGHSEGSLIGMVAAAQAKADNYVSIAGTAKPIDEILREQLKRSSDTSLFNLATPILDSLKQGLTAKRVDIKLFTMLRPTVQPYMMSWMKYDPKNEIKKLTIPVLLVQGTNDLQVPLENVKELAAAKPAAQVIILENMNHVLKTITGDREANEASYKNPALQLAQGLSRDIAAFIKNNPKPFQKK